MLDFHLLLSFFAIFLAWKWGDWRNWKSYYPTILFLIIGDLSYISLTSDKTLWQYESSIFTGDFVELLIAIIIFPCTCLIYFALYFKLRKSNLIGNNRHLILFFLFGASIYTIFEWLSFKLGFFSYHNGWNIYWSFAFNCIMFPLILLHYKKPLWAWPLSVVFAFLIIHIFDLPFTIMK